MELAFLVEAVLAFDALLVAVAPVAACNPSQFNHDLAGYELAHFLSRPPAARFSLFLGEELLASVCLLGGSFRLLRCW